MATSQSSCTVVRICYRVSQSVRKQARRRDHTVGPICWAAAHRAGQLPAAPPSSWPYLYLGKGQQAKIPVARNALKSGVQFKEALHRAAYIIPQSHTQW